eukprot:g29143.t1
MRDTWDTSEAGEPRTVRLPRTVTQETLEKSLAEILNLTDRELNSVRTQDRLAVQTRSGETAAVRVALMSRMLLESREPVERGLRIGIYIQLSNLGLWKRLKACVLTILEATMDENAPNSTRKSTVDVILTDKLQALQLTQLSLGRQRSAQELEAILMEEKNPGLERDNSKNLRHQDVGPRWWEHSPAMALRRVLVTGGNKGIGRALCQQLAADHGFYVFLGSRDAQRGKEAVESILLKSPECQDRLQFLPLDVASDTSVAKAAEMLREQCRGDTSL